MKRSVEKKAWRDTKRTVVAKEHGTGRNVVRLQIVQLFEAQPVAVDRDAEVAQVDRVAHARHCGLHPARDRPRNREPGLDSMDSCVACSLLDFSPGFGPKHEPVRTFAFAGVGHASRTVRAVRKWIDPLFLKGACDQ